MNHGNTLRRAHKANAADVMIADRPTHAKVDLARLDFKAIKVPVTYSEKSVFVPNPQANAEGRPGHCYRLDAAKFCAGEFQCRDSWAIKPWPKEPTP